MILDEDPTVSILVPILLPYIFNKDHEIIHRYKIPGPASRRKSEFFPQLDLCILRSRLNWPYGKRARNVGNTNKVNRFGHFRRNLVITGSTLPASTKIGLLLKYIIYRWFLLTSTAATYDTLYKMLSCLPIVGCSTRVSLFILV